jgi:hypothetical protein
LRAWPIIGRGGDADVLFLDAFAHPTGRVELGRDGKVMRRRSV